MDGSGAVAISNDEASKGTKRKRKTLSNDFKNSVFFFFRNQRTVIYGYYFQIRTFYLHHCHWYCHFIYIPRENMSVFVPFDLSTEFGYKGNGRKA